MVSRGPQQIGICSECGGETQPLHKWAGVTRPKGSNWIVHRDTGATFCADTPSYEEALADYLRERAAAKGLSFAEPEWPTHIGGIVEKDGRSMWVM